MMFETATPDVAAQRIVTAVLSCLTFGAFSIGAYVVFGRGAREPAGFALVKSGTLGTAVLTVMTLLLNRGAHAAGYRVLLFACAAFAVSLALFAWTGATARRARLPLIFSEDAPTRVLADGPYRYLAHPFYTSYVLAYVASVVACPVWWVAVPAAAMIALYWTAARRESARLLAHPVLGDVYARHHGHRTSAQVERRPHG